MAASDGEVAVDAEEARLLPALEPPPPKLLPVIERRPPRSTIANG